MTFVGRSTNTTAVSKSTETYTLWMVSDYAEWERGIGGLTLSPQSCVVDPSGLVQQALGGGGGRGLGPGPGAPERFLRVLLTIKGGGHAYPQLLRGRVGYKMQ